MSAAEWIAKRRELLAEFLKPYRGKRHDNAGLSILAMSDLPRALDALEAVLALHSQSSYLTYCRADGEKYPCPTVDTIEAALREQP